MAETGTLKSTVRVVYPPILNSRPKGVSWGPKPPTWQALQAWPVCTAKLGTAAASVALQAERAERQKTHAGQTANIHRLHDCHPLVRFRTLAS